MTSLLTMFTEINQYELIATSILVMVPTGVAGTLTNFAQKTVHLKTGVLLAFSSSISMYLSSKYITPRIRENDLRILLSIILGLSAIRMLR